MEDKCRWRIRAAEMREKAKHSKEPFVADGFRDLAAQYERLADEGASWLPPQTSFSAVQAGASLSSAHPAELPLAALVSRNRASA